VQKQQIKYLITVLFLLFNLSSFSVKEDTSIDSLNVELSKATTDTTKINILTQLFVEYDNNEDYINSIKYANECLNIINKSDITNEKDIALAYQYLGNGYFSMNMLSKSLDFLTKSLIKYKKLNDTNRIATVYLSLGSLYKRYAKIDLAKENFLNSLKYAKLVNDKLLITSVYNNIGNVYAYTHDWDSSIVYYQKSLKLRIEFDGKGYYAPYMNISRSYANLYELDSAKKYLNIANKYTGDNKYYQTSFLYNYASIIVLENKLDSAEDLLYQSLKISKEKNYNYLTIISYQLLSDISIKQEKYEEALKYQIKYSQLNDSISKYNVQSEISQIELLFENEKNIITIDKLNAVNEVKSLRVFILAITLSLIFIIAVVVFIQKFNLKKAYIKIVEENVKFIELKKSNQELKEKFVAISDTINDSKINVKYKNSSLSDESKSEIANKILLAIEEDKLYNKIDLKINDLAEHLNVNRSYLSQVLTEEIKMSFIDLINNYRVEEAKHLLSDKRFSNLTISAIAEMSGFTPSTFNRVFKNITGVTPSFFMKNSKKKI